MTRKNIIIVTTPRTAGHTMCDHLRAAGMGDPNEFFYSVIAMKFYNKWLNTTLKDPSIMPDLIKHYGQELLKRRTVNGIFSAKIFPMNIDFMKDCIDLKNTDTSYIYLTRDDKFNQFVSFLTLMKTQRPYDSEFVLEHLPKFEKFDEELMTHLYEVTYGAPNYFLNKAMNNLKQNKVIRVSSEQFTQDPPAFIYQVSRIFNVPISQSYLNGDIPNKPKYSKDNDIKKEIIEEYGDMIKKVIEKDYSYENS